MYIRPSLQHMQLRNRILVIGIIVTFFTCKTKTEQTKSFPSSEVVSKQMDSIMGESDLPGLVAIAINKDGERI